MKKAQWHFSRSHHLAALMLCIRLVITLRFQAHGFSPVQPLPSRIALRFDAATADSADAASSRTIIPAPGGRGTSRLMFHYDPSWADSLGSGYAYCLENHYLATQSVTGALCSTMGDAIAQWSEMKEAANDDKDSLAVGSSEGREPLRYDPERTVHYFLKGLGGGIIWAYWFDLSEPLSNEWTHSLLGPEDGAHSGAFWALEERAAQTVINILLEQFWVSPLLFMFWDIPLPALLRGTPLRQIPNQVRTKLAPLLIANAKVWTIVNLVTYNIPVQYRVLFSSCADIVWQSINAGITSQEVPARTIPMGVPRTIPTSSVSSDLSSSLPPLWSSMISKPLAASPSNSTTLLIPSTMSQNE